MKCFLAIDIGASSGRHIIGFLRDGKLRLQEVYRFENGMKHENKDAFLYWDVDKLFEEIINGMAACKEAGFQPESMGIDTWGVDFILLNKKGERIGEAVAYRDTRTDKMDQLVYQRISEVELYQRTGIQKQKFNTIYQLMALKEKQPEVLEQAESFLMIPDYFHYMLTGELANEYTNATTTQLINPITKEWNWEIIRKLEYPERIFQSIRKPGTVLGMLKTKIAEKVGFTCRVVLPATHDTGSAVLALPCQEERAMYISSGTWSLMGCERKEAMCSEQSRKLNFTSEGGYEYRYRFLKNIMGLWMIQSIRHEYQDCYSFAQICSMAEDKKTFPSRVNVDAAEFLAPKNMTEAVKEYCRRTGQQVPHDLGELAAVVYQSLAVCYGKTAEEIEELTGERFETLYVIGGGANADYLNQLTADHTGKTVIAGPAEATALGNIVAQMLENRIFVDIQEARKTIAKSFALKKFYSKKGVHSYDDPGKI
ncbi:rhamnulokinase [Clostridium sp. C105KSO13]|uniref:rhamnulokinase n=1 Tax=Clostridium sp. C105KSO13 TaxID=1776045 RepID=UPI0007406F2F|nr:rhamnulokinase [Clostridium sp. C105KSO13]CUX25037.1 Rhamnulokinase [Clostridium sp. C105KSO13]